MSLLSLVPDTAPSSLTVINKTATTITVSWTALDSSDADGYVVNVTSDTDTVQTVQVEGSTNNTLTIKELEVNTTYSITVRAYQQLLGPASSTISVLTDCFGNLLNDIHNKFMLFHHNRFVFASQWTVLC